MDQSHPAYRFYAERVAGKVVARYADHPAVIGYQVDNEPGLMLPAQRAHVPGASSSGCRPATARSRA